MVVLNYTGEEINAKIVYYGPGLSGKTTNLESLYGKMPEDSKGQMVSMKTRTDRTLFFDFFPLELGEINGYRARFLLYTVPGQVYYNATRKLVLKGADAVVFIADSDASKLQENIDSLRNLEDNLNEHGLSLDTIPWIIQYNKRDLPDASPVATLHQHLNLLNVPAFEAVANTGQGVHETFKSIADILYEKLKEKLESGEAISAAGGDNVPGMPAGTAAAPKDVTETLDSMLREVDTVPVPQPHSQQNESSRDVTQPAVPAIHPAPAAVTPQPPAPPVIQQEVVQPVSQNVDAVQTVESLRDVPTSGTSRTVNSESSATQPAAGPNHQENTPFVPVAPAITAEKPPYPTPVSPVPQPPISPEPVEISPALKNAPVQPRSQSVDSSATQPPTAWAVEPVASVSSNIAVAEPSRPQPADTRQGVSQPWERAYDTPALGKKTGSINPTVDDSSGGIPANSSLSLRSREVEESPDIGRLVELDESAVSTDGVKPQTRPEFITDPMSRGTVAEEEPEIQTDEAPTIADPKPVGKDQEIVVPVFISRSQVNKTIPLKLRLEIRVIDE